MMILYAKPKAKKGKVEENNSIKDNTNTQKDVNPKDVNPNGVNPKDQNLRTDSSRTDSSRTDSPKTDVLKTESSNDQKEKSVSETETKVKFIPYLISKTEEVKLEERSEDTKNIFNSMKRFISILQIIHILSIMFDQNFMFNSDFSKNALNFIQTQNSLKIFYSRMVSAEKDRNSKENYIKEFDLQFSDLLNFDQNFLVVIDAKKEEATAQEFDKIIDSNIRNHGQTLVFSLNSTYRFDINSKEIGKNLKENFYFIATFLLTFFVNRQLLDVFLSSRDRNQNSTQDFIMKLVDTIISPLSNAPSFIKISEISALLKYKQNKILQFYKFDIQNILNDAAFIYKYIISNNIAENCIKVEENTVDIDTCNREDAKNLGSTNLFFTKDKSKEEVEIILTIFFLLKKYNINIVL